jgi:hypothetical protein
MKRTIAVVMFVVGLMLLWGFFFSNWTDLSILGINNTPTHIITEWPTSRPTVPFCYPDGMDPYEKAKACYNGDCYKLVSP